MHALRSYTHSKDTSIACHAVFQFLQFSSCIQCANKEMTFCFSYSAIKGKALMSFSFIIRNYKANSAREKPVHTQVQAHKHRRQRPPTHPVAAFVRSIRDYVEQSSSRGILPDNCLTILCVQFKVRDWITAWYQRGIFKQPSLMLHVYRKSGY